MMATMQYVRYPSTGGGVGGITIGGTVTGGTPGSVLFVGTGPVLAQDNANFNYNSTTHDLSITGALSASNLSGTNTGDVTLTAVGSSPSANGASLSGQVLTLQPADGTHPGLLTSGAQTIGGSKTFSGAISASNLSGTNTGDITLGTANGLSLTGQAISLGLSSASTTGALSSTDWNTFNSASTNSANKALSNLASVAINTALLPNASNSINFGASGLTWANAFFGGVLKAPTIRMNNGAQDLVYIDSNPVPIPSAVVVPAIYNPAGPSGLAGSRDFAVFTETGNSLNPSGSIHIETGNNTNGAGVTGDIILRTGVTSGTRGSISFIGSSIDANTSQIHNVVDPTSAQDAATKNYVDSAVASFPAPLEALASYTSNFWGGPSTFLGNDSDSDQINQTIVLGSTDTAIAGNATSYVVLAAGDNTSAAATGHAGGVIIQAGNVATGIASPGEISFLAGNADSASGGNATLQAGNSITGAGGDLSVSAGNANSGTQNGGNVQISAGTSSGGSGGSFALLGGTGPTNGNIRLQVGVGARIQLQDSSVGTAGYVWTSTDTVGSGTWLPAGGSGSVTSVALADSTGLFNITGSPITSSGTLTLASFQSQAQHSFFAGPSGASGAPTFRAIVASDVPTLNQNTTGTASNITSSSNSTLNTLSALSLPGSQVTGDISGNAANVTGIVAIANGGTGSATQNFVDLSTNQTIAGAKQFSDALTMTEISTPSTPSAGLDKLYVKSDGNLYLIGSDGVERIVGPGMSGTNWQSNLTFVPGAGFGTTSGPEYFYRRVGDSMQVRGSFVCGTVSGSPIAIDLPGGFSLDTAKIATAGTQPLGHWYALSNGGQQSLESSNRGGPMFVDASTSTTTIYGSPTSASSQFEKLGVSSAVPSNNSFGFEFTVPITGWTVNNGNITNSEVWVTDSDVGAPAYGTTNTAVRRFLTTTKNIGTDITYVDDASLGASFTVNTGGVYCITYVDTFASPDYFGIVVNGTQGSTNIDALTVPTEAVSISTTNSSNFGSTTVTLNLSASDVIWAQINTSIGLNPSAGLRKYCSFRVVKIA